MKHLLTTSWPAGTLAITLCCATSLLAERQDRRLMAETCQKGSVAELQCMTAEDIRSLQVYDLDQEGKKHYREHAVTTERHKPQVAAFLQAFRNAKNFSIPRGVPRDPCPPDSVVVIEPVRGEPFEFSYSRYLHEPFAGMYSRELKEALYSLGGGNFPITIIHFRHGTVQRVFHENVIAPHRGGTAGIFSAELHLTPKNGLTVWVNITENGRTVMEGEVPMHFGDAKVFPSTDQGSYIVLLNKPQY
jgi:hypothetical protein